MRQNLHIRGKEAANLYDTKTERRKVRGLLEQLQEMGNYYERIGEAARRSLGSNHQQGRLRVINSHGSFQYYQCTKKGDTKGKYLRKSEQKIAERMAQRDYDSRIIKCADEWQHWVEKTIKSMPSRKLPDIYEKSKGRKQLIAPYEISDAEYAKRWESAAYQGKEFAKDAPEIYTEKGERVRSKSEKIIADKLYMLGIPYRYEYPVRLRGYGTVYPDFLLLDKNTRKECILEHFGMMDNPTYCDKAIKKINLYAGNGYVLGKNFIVTFETADTPLDLRMLQEMVKGFEWNRNGT